MQTILLVQLLDVMGKVAMLNNVVVEFVPICRGSKLWTRIPGQWVEEETVEVQRRYKDDKDEAGCKTRGDQRRSNGQMHVSERPLRTDW
jgi:hypothetical protein